MPTAHREKGYKFYFVMFDLNEPIHIHVDKQGKTAKFWLSLSVWQEIKTIAIQNYTRLNQLSVQTFKS